jgi:hypothetical protein
MGPVEESHGDKTDMGGYYSHIVWVKGYEVISAFSGIKFPVDRFLPPQLSFQQLGFQRSQIHVGSPTPLLTIHLTSRYDESSYLSLRLWPH